MIDIPNWIDEESNASDGTVHVLSFASSHDKRAAYFSMLGNLFGIGLHVFVSSVGLSLLLTSSEQLFIYTQ